MSEDSTVSAGGAPGPRAPEIERAVDAFGTPLYLIDEVQLFAQARSFRDAFVAVRPGTLCCYSYKTNPLLAVVAALARLGYGADVANGHELDRALGVGVDPRRIVFNGPYKTDRELESAARAGVLVHLDGWTEVERAARIAARLGRTVRVGLRWSTGLEVNALSGRDIKFGFDVECDAKSVIERVETDPNLALESLHVHVGTETRGPEPYEIGIGVLERALEALGRDPTFVDIGGGFGTGRTRPFDFGSDAVTPLDRWAARIQRCLERVVSSETTLLVEPGRAVVDGCTTFVTRVVEVKHRAGLNVAILDGGVNLIPSASYSEHPVRVVSRGRLRGAGDAVTEFYGPLCMSSDRVTRRNLDRAAEVGDVVAVDATGAYGYAESWTFGRGRPPVVWRRADGGLSVVRAHEAPHVLDALELMV